MRLIAIRSLAALLLLGAQVTMGLGAHAAPHDGSLPHEPRQGRVAKTERVRTPGVKLWVGRAPQGEGDDLAVNPTRDVVYVTGDTQDGGTTIAYGSSGNRLWRAVLTEPLAEGQAIAVSPNGNTVFVCAVADAIPGTGQNFEFVTLAYDASTGKRLWAVRYNGPLRKGSDIPSAIGVSPGGTRVFVTGESDGTDGAPDYATVAYGSSTGQRLWVARYDGPVHGTDVPFDLAVSPSGTRVFVTGESEGANGFNTRNDYATVAYATAGGSRAWVARYNGPGNDNDGANAVTTSPRGDTVFVTGDEWAGSNRSVDYGTIAYRASTGARRWVAHYNGPGSKNDLAEAVSVNPQGTRVFVTGFSEGKNNTAAFGTVAYGAAGGGRIWVARYVGPAGFSGATAVTIRPDGSQVYVTGPSRGTAPPLFPNPADFATAAYSASTGTKLWVSRFGRAGLRNVPVAIGVNSAGTQVFVTGMSQPDFTTVAYSAT